MLRSAGGPPPARLEAWATSMGGCGDPKIGEAPIAGWASGGGLVRAPTRWEGGGARSSSRTKGVRRLQSLGRSEVSGPIDRRHYRTSRPALRWTLDKEFVRLADAAKCLARWEICAR